MIEDIVKTFQGLTPILWASQICGLLGLVIIGIAYLFKKKMFLLIASISFIFFILEQAFAGLWSGLIVTSLCFVRNIIMLVYLWKKDKSLPNWFITLTIVVMWTMVLMYLGISKTYNDWTGYLPAAIVTMSTITQNNKNEYVVKTGGTLHEAGYLVFYSVYQLPFSILRQCILVLCCFIGLILLIIKNHKKKQLS